MGITIFSDEAPALAENPQWNTLHTQEQAKKFFGIEDTVWAGEKRDRMNPAGPAAIKEARRLLTEERVAVMPGESFGASLAGWLRVSLTQDDAMIDAACTRIAALAARLQEKAA